MCGHVTEFQSMEFGTEANSLSSKVYSHKPNIQLFSLSFLIYNLTRDSFGKPEGSFNSWIITQKATHQPGISVLDLTWVWFKSLCTVVAISVYSNMAFCLMQLIVSFLKTSWIWGEVGFQGQNARQIFKIYIMPPNMLHVDKFSYIYIYTHTHTHICISIHIYSQCVLCIYICVCVWWGV